MPEHTLEERLKTRLNLGASATRIEQFDLTEGANRVAPVVKKKKKKKVKEEVGVGLNESSKKANKILVKLAGKMRTALAGGAKPGGPETEKIRRLMLAINTTRVK